MSLPHPILAIDHGEARIGLAITDPVGIMAHPLETVTNDDGAVARILQLIEQRQVQGLILGLPLRMDGSEGTAGQKVRRFRNQLMRALPTELPFEWVDERMTTITASEKLRAAGKKAKQQKAIIDQAAAVEILNHYLQSQSNPFGLIDPDSEIP